ncbi:MAG: radical SAM protein, partial [Halodesulfovibrio sp.]
MNIKNFSKKLINKCFEVQFPAWEGKNFYDIANLRNKKLLAKKYNLPSTIGIEPISFCTYDCEFCMIRELKTHKYRSKPKMTAEDFRHIMVNISWFTTNIEFSGGEPTMNEHLYDMLNIARDHCVYTTLATNASLLNHKDNVKKILDSPPDAMLVSYEAMEKSEYAITRKKGDLDNVRNGIEKLINEREKRNSRGPIITLQTVVTKRNFNNIE